MKRAMVKIRRGENEEIYTTRIIAVHSDDGGVGSQYGIIGTILGLITVRNPDKWLTWNICTGDGTVYHILRSVGHSDVKVTKIFFWNIFSQKKNIVNILILVQVKAERAGGKGNVNN